MIVETAEGVNFQYVVAGPGKHGPAYAIDFLLRAGMFAFVAVTSVSHPDKTVSGRSSKEWSLF
jgi:hypothetical protein